MGFFFFFFSCPSVFHVFLSCFYLSFFDFSLAIFLFFHAKFSFLVFKIRGSCRGPCFVGILITFFFSFCVFFCVFFFFILWLHFRGFRFSVSYFFFHLF